MVDFSKRLGKKGIDKKIDPIEIYNSLDRRSDTNQLRDSQRTILRTWHESKRDKKDVIVKLHTGAGKTLIGLLMLQSRLNESSRPCLYVCPNEHLAKQVCQDAEKFGITYCVIEDEIPSQFLEGKKILITYSQKVFNGKTGFGLDHAAIEVDGIILDDSHACVETIQDAFTIRLKSEHALYSKLRSLFAEDLKAQGHGTFLEIESGEYHSQLLVPYWSFNNKKDEVLALLSGSKEDNGIKFAWPLIKDSIENMQIHISGAGIEFSPYYVPIERFATFYTAHQRILMSATTQEDSFFIKGLGFEKDSVMNPLEDNSRLWSGERMILIPTLIDDRLDRDSIVNAIAKPSKRNYGTVAIVTSFKLAKQYEKLDAVVANSQDIFDKVDKLRSGGYEKTLILVNRYDGIDLPDDACRILVIDSKPFYTSLSNKYEERCRIDSDVMNIKLAQKVEQGLGRSVRGEKDYSVVFIIGNDLVKFVKSSQTNKYFSIQTRRQIEIGLEIAELAAEDVNQNEPAIKVINNLLKQAIIDRENDGGWKEFYIERMNDISPGSIETKIYDILEKERLAEKSLFNQDAEKSAEIFQNIIDTHCSDDNEQGWYLQQLARAVYSMRQSESNTIQKSAFRKNYQLLKPKEGVSYSKVEFVDSDRASRILDWITKHDSFGDMMLSLHGLLSDLSFGMQAEKFESACKDLGCALGFVSERPDKEHKSGPDNLWCGTHNTYFIFECKNEVEERKEIYKWEVSQFNTHSAWFKSVYQAASVTRIMIISTVQLPHGGYFSDEVGIMRKGKLKQLKNNVTGFFKEFKNDLLGSIRKEDVERFLALHKLRIQDLQTEYTEPSRQKH